MNQMNNSSINEPQGRINRNNSNDNNNNNNNNSSHPHSHSPHRSYRNDRILNTDDVTMYQLSNHN